MRETSAFETRHMTSINLCIYMHKSTLLLQILKDRKKLETLKHGCNTGLDIVRLRNSPKIERLEKYEFENTSKIEGLRIELTQWPCGRYLKEPSLLPFIPCGVSGRLAAP